MMAASIPLNRAGQKCADIALAGLGGIACLMLTSGARAQEWVARADESVVQVIACPSQSDCEEGSGGTGWLVGPHGYIITNYHVIDGQRVFRILIKINGKTEIYVVSLAASSPSHDIAILHLDKPMNGLAVSTKIPGKGGPVTAIGYPGVSDQGFVFNDDAKNATNSTVTSGVLSRFIKQARRKNEDLSNVGAEQDSWIQHTAAINHGNSGGPLFDQCGRVIGINTLKESQELTPDGEVLDIAQGMNWSIPVEAVLSVTSAANLNLDANVSSAPCIPAKPIIKLPPQQNFRPQILLALGIALLAAITSMVAFARKPKAVFETYTQFLRRKGDKHVAHETPHKHTDVFKLVGRSPHGESISLLLKGAEETAGRDAANCDLVLNEESISRQHFAVRVRNGCVSIRDLGSSNGTFIGDRRIDGSWTRLDEGEKITIGRVRLRLARHAG